MQLVDPGRCSPHGSYGIIPSAPDVVGTSALAKSTGPSLFDDVKAWHPDSPMFWLIGLGAVTFGLISFTSSARIGPVRGAVAVGHS